MGAIVDYFKKTLEEIQPWKEVEGKLKELDLNRDDYAQETNDLLNTTLSFVTEGLDAYSTSTTIIYEWSRTTIPLLKTYMQLFKKNRTEVIKTQNTLLLTVLNEGAEIMKSAERKLLICSTSLSQAEQKLIPLSKRFEIEFDLNGNYAKHKWDNFMKAVKNNPTSRAATNHNRFKHTEIRAELESIKKSFAELKEILINAMINFDQTRALIEWDTKAIKNIQTESKDLKVFIDLDRNFKQSINGSIEDLIKKCNEFNVLYRE